MTDHSLWPTIFAIAIRSDWSLAAVRFYKVTVWWFPVKLVEKCLTSLTMNSFLFLNGLLCKLILFSFKRLSPSLTMASICIHTSYMHRVFIQFQGLKLNNQ